MKQAWLPIILLTIIYILAGCNLDSPTDSGGDGGDEGGDDLSVTITNPGDMTSFLEGVEIEFMSTALDYEGNTMTGTDLVWTSNIDGELGTGRNLDTYGLSVNTHVITLTATDSEGYTGSASITIDVEPTDVLVSVPSVAAFPMGWDDNDGNVDHEEPVHTVSLDAFRIGKYEVTYILWTEVKAYADSHGYVMNIATMGDGAGRTPAHPATNIHWRDCIAWCNAYSEMEGLTPVYYTDETQTNLYKDASSSGDGDISSDCVAWSADGFRLLTEAEWEYAARYIDGSSYIPGDEHAGFNLDEDVEACAWFRANTYNNSKPVGQLQPNSLGLYDMSGNGAEWCWDWYQDDYYGESPTGNPHGPETGIYKIYRGGAYNNDSSLKYGEVCYRFAYFPYQLNPSRTFRVCRTGSGE